ncbi:MAG: DUF5715 family protein [Bacteroides sp.]|nr:DUF5715 family protein [Bacteroides sp.]MCM1095053.1 DUF5715 family protein [Terasakiella sp.]
MNRLLIPICLAAAVAGCGHSGHEAAGDTARHDIPLDSLLADEPAEVYVARGDEAPDDGCVRLRVAHIGPLRQAFNDSNHVQLEAARAAGFTPVATDADIWRLERPVVRVRSCGDYYVDELRHSFPYLVPEAADLLADIGHAFRDSLQARGGGDYRIKVTSLLRTPATVRSLRRVNRNATGESTHQYGTTFDISYSKFICDDTTATRRTFEDLKNLLGEILHDMRARGRCYVKYEYRQSCFHITVRPAAKSKSV